MMGLTPPPSVIPYIRANSAYIDTGITPDQTTRVIVWARNFNPGTFVWLFGSRVAYQNAAFNISLPDGASTGSIRIGFNNTNTDAADKFSLLSNYHKYELDGNVLKVDNTVVATATSETFSNQYNIHLFGMNNAGNHVAAGLPIDICACKIYKGGNLVRNFIPVNTPSVGFYDSVSETVFTNAGNDSFTYGTFDMVGYTPLQYVECQSTHIDTGILGTYSLPIVVKFQPNSSNTGFKFLLGSRTSSSSGRCDFMIGNSTTTNASFYFDYHTASNIIYNSTSQTGNVLVWIKKNNTSTIYKSGTRLGTITGATTQSFATAYNIYIGALNNAGTAASAFCGRIYHVGMGSSANFVPAKQGNEVGMYDTYHDVFYKSISSTPFVAGPEL